MCVGILTFINFNDVIMKNIILILTIIFLGVGCTNSSVDPDPNFETINIDQISKKLKTLSYSTVLEDFDNVSVYSNIGQEQIYWQNKKSYYKNNSMIIEIPIQGKFDRVILVARKNGNMQKAIILPIKQKIVISRDERTNIEIFQLFTTITPDPSENCSCDSKTMDGFFIKSDIDGRNSKAYKVKDGYYAEVLAGNSLLQYQKEDFFAFCFNVQNPNFSKSKIIKNENLILNNSIIPTPTIYCPYCSNWLENCTCKRCPNCKAIPEDCMCSTCHICNQTEANCMCAERCQTCGEYQWNCECPLPTPSICPNCGGAHTGDCPSMPTPNICTNIYCIGGANCTCITLTCPCLVNGACSCPIQSTTTR